MAGGHTTPLGTRSPRLPVVLYYRPEPLKPPYVAKPSTATWSGSVTGQEQWERVAVLPDQPFLAGLKNAGNVKGFLHCEPLHLSLPDSVGLLAYYQGHEGPLQSSTVIWTEGDAYNLQREAQINQMPPGKVSGLLGRPVRLGPDQLLMTSSTDQSVDLYFQATPAGPFHHLKNVVRFAQKLISSNYPAVTVVGPTVYVAVSEPSVWQTEFQQQTKAARVSVWQAPRALFVGPAVNVTSSVWKTQAQRFTVYADLPVWNVAMAGITSSRSRGSVTNKTVVMLVSAPSLVQVSPSTGQWIKLNELRVNQIDQGDADASWTVPEPAPPFRLPNSITALLSIVGVAVVSAFIILLVFQLLRCCRRQRPPPPRSPTHDRHRASHSHSHSHSQTTSRRRTSSRRGPSASASASAAASSIRLSNKAGSDGLGMSNAPRSSYYARTSVRTSGGSAQ